MASSVNECSKCLKPIVGNDGFELQSTHELFHSSCYTCDDCGKSAVGKGVSLLENARTGKMDRICNDCLLKRPEFVNANSSKTAPPVIPANNMKCSVCGKNIIGKVKSSSSTGEYFHENCYYKCDKCSKSLANLKYGMVGTARWCQSCISEREREVGDYTTKEKAKGTSQGKIRIDNEQQLADARAKLGKPGTKHQVEYNITKTCSECHKVVYGTPFTIGDDRSRVYHRDCLKCDECKNTVEPLKIKMLGAKKLCQSCAGKYS